MGSSQQGSGKGIKESKSRGEELLGGQKRVFADLLYEWDERVVESRISLWPFSGATLETVAISQV